jgi:hypothetical protein
MMACYIIRAARDEETNNGWVWMAKPSRTTVRISRNGRAAFCQVRDIRDENFLEKYRNDPAKRRIPISKSLWNETIVMAKWYRDALGGFKLTADDNKTGLQHLDVKEVRSWGWGPLRAACQQPDSVVRLGTRLGVVGVWLGIVGLMSAFAGVEARNKWILLAVPVLTGALGYLACRGPRPVSVEQNG